MLTSDIGVSADKPALLDLRQRPRRRCSRCRDLFGRFGPKRGLKRLAMFVDREGMEGKLVVQSKMRIEEKVLSDLLLQRGNRAAQRPDRVPNSDQLDLGRRTIFHDPAFLEVGRLRPVNQLIDRPIAMPPVSCIKLLDRLRRAGLKDPALGNEAR